MTLWQRGVRNFVFSSLWGNSPVNTALMVQQAWCVHFTGLATASSSHIRSRRYPSNLVAGSVNGGGVYTAGQPLATFFNASLTPTDVQQLLVAVVSSAFPDPAPASADDAIPATMPISDGSFVFARCTSADFVTPLPCVLFEAVPSQTFTTPLAYGLMGCQFQAETAPTAAAGHWYAFVAVDEVFTAPGTPDPCHIRACMFLSCTARRPSDRDTVACSPDYNAAGTFMSFSILGNFTDNDQVLPYLALDQVR